MMAAHARSDTAPAFATYQDSLENQLGTNGQRLILAMLILYIIGGHLRLSIYVNGSILVPMYLMLVPSAVLALWFAKGILYKTAGFLLLMLTFIALQPLAGGGASGYLSSIKSGLQLAASLIGALAVIFALGLVNHGKLRRVLIILWLIIVVLAFAESTYFKAIFDHVREWLYAGSGRFIYLAESRDLQIYGRVRTTVFASEPSFLADTLSALTVMVFLLHEKRTSLGAFLQLGVMVVLSFLVAPSFKTVFYLIALLVWQFWPRDLRGLIALALVLVVVLIVGEGVLGQLRDISTLHLSTGSFFGRIGSAHLVGLETLARFPFYGIGIGNNDDIYDIIVSVWNETGAFILFPWYGALSAADLMSNGFWWMWIYLGIMGGVTFLILAARLLRGVGVMTPWRSLTCAAIVWYAGSAFVDPQSWFVVVIFSTGALGPNTALRSGQSIGPTG